MKNYKTILIRVLWFYIILLFISCKTKENSEKNINLKITDNYSIIGKWRMCSYTSKENNYYMNICPTILFYYNGTGQIFNGTNLKENFSWSLRQKFFFIYSNVKREDQTFYSPCYKFSINDSIIPKRVSLEDSCYKYYLTSE